ncbi:hypothetical protein CFP56_018453, partial [Quercus suber]
PKELGKKSSCYVLIKSWNEVVSDKGTNVVVVAMREQVAVVNEENGSTILDLLSINDVAGYDYWGRVACHQHRPINGVVHIASISRFRREEQVYGR